MYCPSTFMYVSSNYIIMCWWWCQCDDGDANVMPMFCQCVDGDANVMIPCDDGNDVFLCNRGRCRCTQSHDWMRKTANGSHDWMPKTDRHQGSRRHVTARSRRHRCHRSRPHPSPISRHIPQKPRYSHRSWQDPCAGSLGGSTRPCRQAGRLDSARTAPKSSLSILTAVCGSSTRASQEASNTQSQRILDRAASSLPEWTPLWRWTADIQ